MRSSEMLTPAQFQGMDVYGDDSWIGTYQTGSSCKK